MNDETLAKDKQGWMQFVLWI